MAVLLVMLAAAAVSTSAPSAIQGKWAADPRSCTKPQDSQDAPTVIHGSTMNQHEASCTFSAFRGTGPNRWTARGSCTVEGNSQGLGTYKFERSGQTLRIKEPDSLQPNMLTRCRK